MRVSVVNFCSTADEMLNFSSIMLLENAGTNDFDYVVVTWNPTRDVIQWIAEHEWVIRVDYQTDPNLAYVPNLRSMFNYGFGAGYELNDYVVIVNTDMAFGTGWLINLVRRAEEDVIPNSLHLTPIVGPNVITVDLGVPGTEAFDLARFWRMHDELNDDLVEAEKDRGGWKACATLPYVVHRKWWGLCGPWETEVGRGHTPPDQRFFRRCHDAGARFILVHDSIVYHHEAVERRSGRRPVGAEAMAEGR